MKQQPNKKVGCIAGIIVLICAAICIFAWISMPSSGTEKNTDRIEKSASKIDAWVAAQYFVEDRLKAPSSAKFPFGGAQKHVSDMGGGLFIIRSYVDSKNAFGVEIRTKFFCKIQKNKKGSFDLIQLTFEE